VSNIVWYPGHDLLVKDIVRAENCHLYDAEGKRYVDLESGVWCTSIGHCHPRILRVLAEQSARIAHTGFGYSSGIVEEAAQEILSLVGFRSGQCVFLCSGSEAVEYGVRTAQSVIERPLLMAMADSYFGAYGSASRREEDQWFSFDWTACVTCSDDGECDGACEHWANIPFDDIGGFLFEPGSSGGMVRFPPKKLIRNIAAVVRGSDGLVLVNEVTTGVGRTGLWFGYQHYDLSPDIVALGKGIGNGYPVSVTALGVGVTARLGGNPLKYAQSHQNDPLGAAIAQEVVTVIKEEELIERGRGIASILLSGLEEVRDRTGGIEQIRARGLMVALDLADDPQGERALQAQRGLAQRGYILARRPGLNVLRLDPSLTIEKEDIAGFLEAFEALLDGPESDGDGN
jgi:acetylornithine aminotransferase